jgi:suppressor of fused-like protein
MSPGLRELEAHLTKSFAGHRDPQIIPRWGIPHWMGGNEAIDFIYVYSINHPELGEYWHFITAGLSDLFGDGRVNFPIYEDHDLSGFGIELSIMVRKQSQHIPVWPPTILHKLARYIFESGNRILPGDNIPNNMPIENNSSLRHFLAVGDLFVKKMNSTIGEVTFVQLVGLADNEWNAANNWSGSQFSDLLIGEFLCWLFSRKTDNF